MTMRLPRSFASRIALAAWLALPAAAFSTEFSVTPIRAELKAGALTETITVFNESPERLKVNVRLVEWTQDEKGADVYQESTDLVYFPRQLELEPQSRRLVRVGVRTAGGATERAYRLYIEEVPKAPAPGTGTAQVNFFFRFGVPVFVAATVPKPVPEVMEATQSGSKVEVLVKNSGNAHFRLTRVTVSDGGSYSQDIAGWYSLAGTTRTYSVELPREVCRRGGAFQFLLEGEGLKFERKLNVDPSRCA